MGGGGGRLRMLDPLPAQRPHPALCLQLGEQLKQLVPASGLTVMDLETEGSCVRFSPLTTAAGNEPLRSGEQQRAPVRGLGGGA